MKLALISGGSRGLGAALCGHYRGEGWRVVGFSRTAAGEDDVRLDLSQPERIAATVEAALAPLLAHPPDEVVVVSNAAALGPVGPLVAHDDAAILANIAVNLGGGIVFMNTLLRRLATLPARKTLVNISSGAAQRGLHGWSLYCTAKAGLEKFIESVALEQAGLPHPFTAINISPGVIDTDMQAEIRASGDHQFPERERFVALKREGGLRPPAVVARAVAAIVRSDPRQGGRYEVSDYVQDNPGAGSPSA